MEKDKLAVTQWRATGNRCVLGQMETNVMSLLARGWNCLKTPAEYPRFGRKNWKYVLLNVSSPVRLPFTARNDVHFLCAHVLAKFNMHLLYKQILGHCTCLRGLFWSNSQLALPHVKCKCKPCGTNTQSHIFCLSEQFMYYDFGVKCQVMSKEPW